MKRFSKRKKNKNRYEHELEASGLYLPKQDHDSGETLGRGVAGRVLPKAVSHLDLVDAKYSLTS